MTKSKLKEKIGTKLYKSLSSEQKKLMEDTHGKVDVDIVDYYFKVEDNCVPPMILRQDNLIEYLIDCAEGSGFKPVKVTVIQITEKKFNRLPEFQG